MSSLVPRAGASFCHLLLFLILFVSVTATGSVSASDSSRRLLDSDLNSEAKIKPKKIIASDENVSAKPKTVGEVATKSKKVAGAPIDGKSEVKVKTTKAAGVAEEITEGKVKKVKAPVDEKVKKLKDPISSDEKLGKKVSKEKSGEPDAKVKKQKNAEGEYKLEEKPKKAKAKPIDEANSLKPNSSQKNITRTSVTPKSFPKIIKPLRNQTKDANTSATKTNTSATKKKLLPESAKIDMKKSVSPSSTNFKPPNVNLKIKTKTNKSKETHTTPPKAIPKSQKRASLMDTEDDSDFVSQIRGLPSKFNQILPDIQKISIASKSYLTKANKEVTKGIKPIIGSRYASAVASFISLAFIVMPLILASLIFHHIKTLFSLQKILIFIQAYLAIYFSILCVSCLVTGLEPLRFFFATSKSTYMCVMVLQTLAYGLYLLLLLMYAVLVFSTETTRESKWLGMAQMVLGYAVGVHFYVAVVHRVASHLPPLTNWRIHGVYGVCFAVVCAFAALEKKKKAYMGEGGQEGKTN